MALFRSMNVGATISPVPNMHEGYAPTPVFYDPNILAPSDIFPIGKGTQYSCATDDRDVMASNAWRQLGMRCALGLLITPIKLNSSTDVTAADPFLVDLGFDIGPQATPSTPGRNFTGGGPGIAGQKNFYTDGYLWKIGSYDASAATQGMDSLYVSFIVNAQLGKYPFFTKGYKADGQVSPDPDLRFFWREGVSLSWDVIYIASGAGFPPDYPPVNPTVISVPFSSESANSIQPVESGRTIYQLFDDYNAEITLGIDDLVNGTSEAHPPILRTYSALGTGTGVSTARPNSGIGMQITAYEAPRDPL